MRFSTTLSLPLALSLLAGCGVSGQNRMPGPSGSSLDPARFRADGVNRTHVLVRFRDGLSTLDASDFSGRHGVRLTRSIPALNTALVTVSGSPEETIARLARDPAVAHAEVDRAVALDDVSVNDPRRGEQYPLDRVQAGKAWEITRGSDQVVVAIIDTGIDLGHPDLKSKLVAGTNTLEAGSPPRDDRGHGTHVAGIAVAATNNREGIAGLASNCRLMPVRVTGNQGGTTGSVAAGLVWAADHRADVANMSLGFYEESDTLRRAVDYALSKNVVLVSTMGNDRQEKPRYPAAYPGVIAVGSTDAQDQRSGFSNYGSWMSVSAPGKDVLSTFPTYTVRLVNTPGYGFMTGTSMAAPLVSGLCGLVRSKHPGMAPAEVKRLIEETARDLGDPGPDVHYGHGRIDAYAALSR
jgi:subtilisin family serine protease